MTRAENFFYEGHFDRCEGVKPRTKFVYHWDEQNYRLGYGSASEIPSLSHPVGDIDSDERGSGARAIGGKPKLEYVPLTVLLSVALRRHLLPEVDLQTMEFLADFEARDDLHGASKALERLWETHGIESTCAQFDFGAKKYKAWNWAKGMKWSVPLACIKRHLWALLNGEDIDPESGVSHWGAIGCNLVMLAHFATFYPEGDDRPPASMFAVDTPAAEADNS